MHVSRGTKTAALVALLLFAGSLTGTEDAGGQKPATRAGASSSKMTFQRRLEARRIALEGHERKRQEILGRLEFTPRRALPGLPPRFPALCLRPPATAASAIDPHRSLFVHDRSTLDASGPDFTADFSLNHTLSQIANQVSTTVPGTTAVGIFRQLWDTQGPAPGVTTGPHCDDNGTTINGFPINCPRNESREARGTDSEIESRMAEYKALALVNRIDLAHEGWRNCGEYRIVYGRRANGENLIIFEAVLPNPRPGCREACLPVAEFWKSLSAIDDSVSRAEKLQEFFYDGLPGFRPVVHVSHYSAKGVSSSYGSSGSGQIRTNQFLQDGPLHPWLLKEFKTVLDCGVAPCKFVIVPVMVKVNPHGPLWNEDNAGPRAVDFRADTLLQTAALASTSLMGIGYEVDLVNDAGQSMEQAVEGFVDDYRAQMDAAAATTFRTALVTGSLTADQMANRALTQSCAGCHEPRTFSLNLPDSIGTVTTPVGSSVPTTDTWPASVGFVHVKVVPNVRPEFAANPAAFGSGQGQEISPALLDFFLPARKNFLLAHLNSARCTCVRRFGFLDAVKRRVALDIETKVQREFSARFEELEKRLAQIQTTTPTAEEVSKLARERNQLVSERDKALSAELRRNGITLPDDELLNLKPESMKLKAGGIAKGNAAREAGLRTEEVNRILREEPPRRTVTGSFRVH